MASFCRLPEMSPKKGWGVGLLATLPSVSPYWDASNLGRGDLCLLSPGLHLAPLCAPSVVFP